MKKCCQWRLGLKEKTHTNKRVPKGQRKMFQKGVHKCPRQEKMIAAYFRS